MLTNLISIGLWVELLKYLLLRIHDETLFYNNLMRVSCYDIHAY
jgi:hypothetical protein